MKKDELRIVPGFSDPQIVPVLGMGGKLCQQMGEEEELNLLAYLVAL